MFNLIFVAIYIVVISCHSWYFGDIQAAAKIFFVLTVPAMLCYFAGRDISDSHWHRYMNQRTKDREAVITGKMPL